LLTLDRFAISDLVLPAVLRRRARRPGGLERAAVDRAGAATDRTQAVPRGLPQPQDGPVLPSRRRADAEATACRPQRDVPGARNADPRRPALPPADRRDHLHPDDRRRRLRTRPDRPTRGAAPVRDRRRVPQDQKQPGELSVLEQRL